jgi:NTP pyrophosphatase (non-canonical NTP hydrolase)
LVAFQAVDVFIVKEWFNMLNVEQYLLAKLAEECGEVVQMALKSSYFGLDEVRQGQNLTNRQRLNFEIDDLLIILTFLKCYGIFSYEDGSPEQALAKKAKVEKFWDLATSRGNVEKRMEIE